MSERGEARGPVPDVLMHAYEVSKYKEYVETLQAKDPNAQIVGSTERTQNYDGLAIAGEEFIFDRPPLWRNVRRLLGQETAVDIQAIEDVSKSFGRFLFRDHQGKVDRADAVLATVHISNAMEIFRENFFANPSSSDVIYANRLKAFGYKCVANVFNQIKPRELSEDVVAPDRLFTAMLGEGTPKSDLLMNFLEVLEIDTHEVRQIIKNNDLSDLVSDASKAEQQKLRVASAELAKNLRTEAEYGLGSIVIAGRDIGLDCNIIVVPPEEFSVAMPEGAVKGPEVLANFIFVEPQDVHNTTPTRTE